MAIPKFFTPSRDQFKKLVGAIKHEGITMRCPSCACASCSSCGSKCSCTACGSCRCTPCKINEIHRAD